MDKKKFVGKLTVANGNSVIVLCGWFTAKSVRFSFDVYFSFLLQSFEEAGCQSRPGKSKLTSSTPRVYAL